MQSFIDHPVQHDAPTSLTTGQLDRLRAELEASLDELRGRLQRNEDLFGALVTDSSVAGAEREAARRAAEQAGTAIQEAERALAQMRDGTYGRCAGCGRSIPFERLEVVPQTRTCVACPGD